jgi:hypothetical protein
MSSSMCAASVIYDMFGKMPDGWYNQKRINLFKTMIVAAEMFDQEANQPDCVDPEKEKLLEHIEELEKQLEK